MSISVCKECKFYDALYPEGPIGQCLAKLNAVDDPFVCEYDNCCNISKPKKTKGNKTHINSRENGCQ